MARSMRVAQRQQRQKFMLPPKVQVLAGFFAAALMAFVGCSSGPDVASAPKEKIPVLVGQTRYKDQLIPVFDGLTVKCEKSTPPQYPSDLRRSGTQGEGVVMIIVNEEGQAVEFGIVSSTPDPQFGVATLLAAKRWRYFPMKNVAGVPFLHALRMPVQYRLAVE